MTQDAFMAPGAFDADAEQIRRRMAFAQALQQQSAPPKGEMVGNRYVAPSWTQHASSLANALIGAGQERKALQDFQALGERRREEGVADMSKFADLLRGTPAKPTGETFTMGANETGDETTQVPQWQAGTAPDLNGAYTFAMGSRSPELRQVGMQGIAMLPKLEADKLERAENREWRSEEARQNRQARIDALQLQHQQRLDALAAQNANAQQIAEANRQFQLQLKQMGLQQGAQPYFQPLQTANGVFAFNARTGKVEPVASPDGKQIVGAQFDATLQGNIAGAKEGAELGAKSVADAKKNVKRSEVLLSQLDQAEKLLQSQPTASGIGSVVDKVGNAFGVSTQSADNAAKLDAISGWLVSNVPRMEGPQSNFDVKNYQTMAGMVGDRTIPISQRLSALTTVRQLQEKYKHLNQEDAGVQPAKAPASRIKFDAQGNIIK